MAEPTGTLIYLPTAYLTAGVLYVLFSFAAWLALRAQANRATHLWCTGGVLIGVGFILLGLRLEIPPVLSYLVAIGLLAGGNVMHVCALRQELGRPFATAGAVALFLAVVVPFEVFRLGLQSPGLRFLWATVWLFVLIVWTSALSWTLALQEQSRSARWLALAYAVLAVSLVARLLSFLLGLGEPDALAATATGSAMLLSAMLASAIGNAAIIGLYLERSSRKNVDYAVAENRARFVSRLRDQMTDLDRERVLAELSFSLAHELGQPVTGILADSGAVKARSRLLGLQDASINAAIASLERHALRARDIIRGIRGLSSTTQDHHALVEVRTVVQNVLSLLDDAVRLQRIRFEIRGQGERTQVMAHEVLLSLVFLNVFRNALEAHGGPDPARVTIEFRGEGGRLHVIIQDNGPGFSPEALHQACDPFFTTKPGGLGVGLALSQRIVAQHEGHLSVRNHSAGGGVVELTLPLAEGLSADLARS